MKPNTFIVKECGSRWGIYYVDDKGRCGDSPGTAAKSKAAAEAMARDLNDPQRNPAQIADTDELARALNEGLA